MQINEDVYIGSSLTAQTLVPSPGCVLDAHVNAGAAVQATKLQHRYRQIFQQDALVAGTFCLHVCQSAVGTQISFKLGVRTIGIAGAGTVATLDVKKGGTSVAPGGTPINLMPAGGVCTVARTIAAQTLTVINLTQGDWFDVVVAITAGSGTLPTGLYACLEVDELPN